jgi:hypothetical protein
MKKIIFILSLLITSIGFSQTELLTNGDFSNGETSWALTGGSVASGEAAFATTNAAGDPWTTQLVQAGLKFNGAQEYTVTFDARADAARVITLAIQNIGVWSDQFRQDFTLTTTMATYTATFNAASTNTNAQLGFLMAGFGVTDGVYYDNISLTTVEVVPSCDDGIQNGDETGIDCGGSACGECPEVKLPLDFSDVSQLFTYDGAGPGGSVVLENGKLRFNGNGQAYDQAYLDLTTTFSLLDKKNNTFTVTMEPLGVADGEVRTHRIRADFAGGSAAGKEIEGKSIGSAEQDVTFNFGELGAEAWNRIVIFMDFGLDGSSTYNAKVTDYLISSISLGSDPPVTQVPPTEAAPPPPARNAADVVSIYSKTTATTSVYTDIEGTYYPAWGVPNGDPIPEAFQNDLALKLPTFTFQGIEFPVTDLSGMTMLHLDIWAQSQGVGLDLIPNPGAAKQVNIASNDGEWSSVDIPLTDFPDLDLSKIFQMKFYGLNGANADGTYDIYLDNIYFWKEPTAAGTDVTLSDLTIDGTTVTGFSAVATSYTVDLLQGTTTAPSIAAVPTDSNATVSVTDAASIPGSGSVLVTAADGTTTATVTVNFTATIPTDGAQAPTQLEADVVSVYSDTYSTNILTNNNPGWGQATQVTEVQLGTNSNNTLKYSNLNYQGMLYAATDVSSMDYVHLDYYTNDATALEFSVIMEDTGENKYDIVAEDGITTGQWVSVDIPLSHYTVTNLTGVNQFKTVGNGTVYIDNLFFWNSATASAEDFATISVKMYPNPAKGVVNFTSASNADLDVAVYDLLGKQVMDAQNVQSQLNISSLNPGMYFVKMTQGSSSATKKLVVK